MNRTTIYGIMSNLNYGESEVDKMLQQGLLFIYESYEDYLDSNSNLNQEDLVTIDEFESGVITGFESTVYHGHRYYIEVFY